MRLNETMPNYDYNTATTAKCTTPVDPSIHDNADSAIRSLTTVFEILGQMESRLFGTGLKANDPRPEEISPSPINSQVRRLSQDAANLVGFANTLVSRL